jgi:thiol:disulfide interchange protein
MARRLNSVTRSPRAITSTATPSEFGRWRGTTLGTPQIPKGKEKTTIISARSRFITKLSPFACRSSAMPPPGVLPLKLNVTSQGCADAGVCYPPQTQAVSLELPDPASAPSINAAPAAGEGDESGRIAAALKDAGFWANLAFFFLAGLGLSLTPCVFPMIPILSGIIAGQGHKISRGRGFALVADLRAGHGGDLRGRRCCCRNDRHAARRSAAKPLGARRLCAGLRRAVLFDVRFL